MPERSLTDRMLRSIERHAMFAPGQRVGVAVSGGADSVFLLHMLLEQALQLSVVHVDHGLRGDASRADAEFVGALAKRLGLPFLLYEAQVGEGNLEQEARRARYRFFGSLLEQDIVTCVATGHTRSDQAETVMYRILRGSGLAGLRGVLPVRPMPGVGAIVRPLLEIDRSEIEMWLRDRGLPWQVDAMNAELSYARNRLRHGILPQLRSTFNPKLDETLAHLAILAQDEEEWANAHVTVPSLKAGAVCFDIHELTGAAPAHARRKIRLALEAVKGDLRQIDFAHVETVLELARSALGSGRVQLPGLDIYRSFDGLRIAATGHDSRHARDWAFPIAAPGSISVAQTNTVFHFELTSHHDKVEGELDWPRLAFPERPLTLRNWRPGDVYLPTGQSQPQKLKYLFQAARIPLWERRTWPVLLSGDEIVWTRRFGPSVNFAASPDGGEVLRIREDDLPWS